MDIKEQLTYKVHEVAEYINWTYFFHAWGFAPPYAGVAGVCDCASCKSAWISGFPREQRPKAREAAQLYDDACRQLQQLEGQMEVRVLFRLCPAHAEEDNLIISGKTFPLLRQQQRHAPGQPCLCLSDFVRPAAQGPDTVGLFAATVQAIATATQAAAAEESNSKATATATQAAAAEESPCKATVTATATQAAAAKESPCKATATQAAATEGDAYTRLLHQTLADRLAEAAVEKMHQYVRKEAWGYAAAEQLDIPRLHREEFQGIRPAVGYPSLPDQSVNFLIDELLNMRQIGISLTENGAMCPPASVSGLMLAHPEARYFSIGKIGEDQLADYARRRGLPVEVVRKFLAANL